MRASALADRRLVNAEVRSGLTEERILSIGQRPAEQCGLLAIRLSSMTVMPKDLTGFRSANEKISIANLAQGVRMLERGAGG